MSVGLGDPGGQQPESTPSARKAVSLAAVFPDVVAAIPDDERALAERALWAPALSAGEGDLRDMLAAAPAAFGFLIVEGVVLKETVLATRSALELLNCGDIVSPPLVDHRQEESRAASRYLAHGPVTLAVLGPHFRAALRRWPPVADDLLDRTARQAHRASAHLAMLHVSRVEERIALLFEDLSERCGRVTPDGVMIDISLTHRVIGGLVGAQRPTVTLALQTLADQGALHRVGTDRWMIPRGGAT